MFLFWAIEQNSMNPFAITLLPIISDITLPFFSWPLTQSLNQKASERINLADERVPNAAH